MRVQFWGVRGLLPSPGPQTNRYGGNTPCVSIEARTGELLIIDMGTGLFHLGNQLMTREFREGRGKATVLLSHAHWDHAQGLGFFAPVFVAGNQFHLFGHAESPAVLEGILEGHMNPNFSPIQTLRNLGAGFVVDTIAPGSPIRVGSLTVRAALVPHGASTVLVFRVEEDNGKTFVYASDVSHASDVVAPELRDICAGADVLLHDCTYHALDQAARREYGYSSPADAARCALAAQAKSLVLFHFSPDYSDAQVDRLVAECKDSLRLLGGPSAASVPVQAAYEGWTIEL